MSRRELWLHVFIPIASLLGILWSVAIHNRDEVVNCVIVWAVAHVVTRILGATGQFDKRPTDEEAGVDRGGQGR